MSLQTIFEFDLPRGYLDADSMLHRHGTMRLATALDEIEVLHDPRAQHNEAFLPVLLLSRVINQLGALPAVTPDVIAGLFASDLIYLEDLYQRINSADSIWVGAVCPHCTGHFQLQIAPLV
jgi:hypothetical protein